MDAVPTLPSEHYLYTRLKGVIWCANGLCYPTQLQASAGDVLAKLVEANPEKPLVLNCHGVTTIDDHALDSLGSSIKRTKAQVLLIGADQLDQDLPAALTTQKDSFSLADGGGCTIAHTGGDRMSRARAEELRKAVRDYEKRHLAALVKKSFRNQQIRLSSTPLWASGVFDARSLVSDPKAFVWISLCMAEELEHIFEKNRPPHPRLLAVSLRASPFAAAIGLLTGRHLQTEIVDHLGPKHQILEEYSLTPASAPAEYIYIGDFIIGGTELKIAQTYAYSRRSSLGAALVIGTALSPDQYPLPFQILPLVKLYECGLDVRYQFGGQPQ